MNTTSTAYIIVQDLGYRYSFDGVTSISHSLTLKWKTDSDSSKEGDVINNARNEPDVVTLSVVASDNHVAVAGWAQQTFRSLASIKEYRYLCTVVTPMRTYEDMLLTGILATQDESCPEGWTGTLTFTHLNSKKAKSKKANNQSSTPTTAGNAAMRKAGEQDGAMMRQILKEAGIQVE